MHELELTSAGVDGCGTECLPYDGLADVSGDEERYPRAQTISFLEEFVEKQDDHSGNKELDDDEQTNTGSDAGWLTIHASHDVDNGLTNGDDHSEY